ncbi:MAG: SDR family oxidoreductase [Acholeplasmataceae bacterium]|nr:SDR family oxidoreductase [Acholeplasmataceae bacterium]
MIVIITGVSSGVGLANAKKFIEKGHTVYGISRREVLLEGLTHYQADITDHERINQIVDEIYAKENRIDVLINSAGMGISGAVEDTEMESAKRMFDINFFGTVNISNRVIPYMRENGFGRICNISSVAGVLPIAFQTFYSSNKAAISLYSEGLNIEVKPFGIRVIDFMPGDIKTGFTDNRKKNESNSKYYGKRIDRSVKVMEKDERNGMSVEYVSKVMYRNIMKKRPPVRKVVGVQYKFFLFLYRLLPIKFVNYVMGKLYG